METSKSMKQIIVKGHSLRKNKVSTRYSRVWICECGKAGISQTEFQARQAHRDHKEEVKARES